MTVMTDPLQRVRWATRRREAAEEEWRSAIRKAVAAGLSLRRVADAAGLSHVRVLQITREDESGRATQERPRPSNVKGDRDAQSG
jgi:hypothetical protein